MASEWLGSRRREKGVKLYGEFDWFMFSSNSTKAIGMVDFRYEKRIRLKGIVSRIGPDEFGAPSFQFTDETQSRCYALIVFPTKDIYDQVQEGSRVEIIGNVVFIREPYGLVVKKCELLGPAEI